MLEKACLSFKKSKFFLGSMPQTPLRLSQNPSYGPDLLPYDVYTY